MKLFRLAVLPLALMTTAAYASEYDAAMRAYLDSSIRTWANDPVLVAAINAANTERAGIDQARIDNMDTAWRAEVGQADSPTITPTKASVIESGAFVTRQGIQLHGGIGVTDEHDVGLYFKRMHILATLFGDDAFHLARYASLPSFSANL